MLLNLAVKPIVALLQEDSPGVSPVLLGIIAILLVALFIWLLLRGPKAGMVPPAEKKVEKPVEPAAPVAAAPADEIKVFVPFVAAEPVASAPVAAEPVVEAAVVSPTAEPAAVVEEVSAVKASAPVAEDLEIIEGIGPKIAGVLKQAGVTSFAQLAEMAPESITEILHAANLRLADPKSWPEQARLAATGDQAGLQALQDRLKGGRIV
jgi:predicted flap endonuclease-1-like 5' DNA nuclease